MAQTKRKRRRKHKGTQAGTIEHRSRTGQAAIAAALFGVLVVALFGRPVREGVTLAAFMVLVYIPLGFLMDKGIYNWRQRRKQASRK